MSKIKTFGIARNPQQYISPVWLYSLSVYTTQMYDLWCYTPTHWYASRKKTDNHLLVIILVITRKWKEST